MRKGCAASRATTPVVAFPPLAAGAAVPSIFNKVFEMTYPTLHIADRQAHVYGIQAAGRDGGMPSSSDIWARFWAASPAQFRSSRALYIAMQCRGYAQRFTRRTLPRIIPADWLYRAFCAGAILLFRVINNCRVFVMNSWAGCWNDRSRTPDNP
jgi:hypothetical protein